MLLDLSVTLNVTTPTFPGDPKVAMQTLGTLEKDGCAGHSISLSAHTGTHMDAPAHMLPGTKNLDEFPLEKFTGHGVCINIDKEFRLADIKEIPIQQDDIVLFHTGMDQSYLKPKYFENFPAIPADVAHYLVEKKVKMIGVDTCSPDYSPYTIHKIFLQDEILILENLTNLAPLVGKDFTVYAFPLKLDIHGAPVRVVAEITE